MTDTLHANSAFIRERKSLLDDLTAGFYRDIAEDFRRRESLPPTPDEIADLYESIGTAQDGRMPTPDFAGFCRAFSSVYGHSLTEPAETESETAPPKIAYLQNTFSDRAYRCFSEKFERVSAVYFAGFREVCEEVYNGGCPYAMLPVHSSRDGQLISFRKLISKYDLKITMVTDVEMNDDSTMRFALLQKGIDSRTAASMRYLDLSIVLEGSEYGMFLSACESLGAVVLMMNSLPLEYADDRCGLILQFDISSANRDALFLFLEGSHIRYDIVGIYDVV